MCLSNAVRLAQAKPELAPALEALQKDASPRVQQLFEALNLLEGQEDMNNWEDVE